MTPNLAGGHLLDGAVLGIAVGLPHVTRRVFAALARVAFAADAVHGDGQGFVRFLADGAVGHGAGFEAPENRLHRLDFLQRDRLGSRLQIQQAAQRAGLLCLVIDLRGITLESLVVPVAAGFLQRSEPFAD